ncbi:hypothetical protein ACE83Q_06695 [Dellaglioa sp. P0083]|uniref:lectin-like domain-containing protein n=1 Tax=Dellaglioa kimchii TaxID=3344667 RepID=UPI0038D4D48F
MKINNKLTLLTFGLFFLVNVTSIKADADYDSAKLSAPRAILMTNLFQTGTGAGVTSTSGMVGLTDTNKDPNSTNKATKTMVKITDDKKQKAAIWSTDENSFDINTSSKASMWIYFGSKTNTAGDGMALVFQNDAKGNAAIATKAGETLGVWGDDSVGTGSPNYTTRGAIQNSWALEFDTHLNNGNSSGNGFDVDPSLTANHIASGYPAVEATYTDNHTISSSVKLNHLGLINYNGYLSNRAWHHVTIDYKSVSASAGSMTYTIDDKKPISGTDNLDPTEDTSQTGQTASVPIDKSKFNSTTGKIRWGFTGSTGDSFENNLVMFETVPGLVNATAVQTMTDITQNNKDVSANGEVKAGDKVKFTTKATYNSGKQTWTDIVGHFKYPTHNIKWTDYEMPDIIGTGKFPDSAVGDDPSTLASGTPIPDLSTPGESVEVSFIGEVMPVEVDTPVTVSAGQFIGSNAMIDSNPVSYTIKASPKTALTIDGLKDIDINYGTDATISGTVKSSLGGTFAKGTTASVTLNEDTTPIKGDVATDGTFNVTIPKDKLTTGEYTYNVQVTDPDGNTTQKYTQKINIKPVLTLNDNKGTVVAPYTLIFQVADNSAALTTYYKEGSTGTPVELEKYTNTKPGSTQDHSVALDTTKFAIGTHELTIYSVDSEGNISNNQTISVVVGLLSISSDDSINFNNKIPAKRSILNRDSSYMLKLETSAAKNWTLSVTAGPLTATSDKSTLKHSTIGFRNSNQENTLPLSPTYGTIVATGVGQATTVEKSWSADSGIVLDVEPSEIKVAETYSSELDWTLTNVPNN